MHRHTTIQVSSLAFVFLLILVPRPCPSHAGAPAQETDSTPVLYLVNSEADTAKWLVPSRETVCSEPNLVVITHGWYEREPWPGWTAKAIARKVNRRHWRCGWWDWRGQAKRLRPAEAATIGRDRVGPQLGRQILKLSKNWRHVHLIGHSAGSWTVNAAAEIIARETQADIHITFLDAYVPDGWDERFLGRLARQTPDRCWVEHYFTRDLLNLTENELSQAHNVDITEINPGFKGHKFPWHWYHATITGRYTTRQRLAHSPVFSESDALAYGFARALENGSLAWKNSMALALGNEPVRIHPRR